MKKVISILLVIMIVASMIPAAHADTLDVYFSGMIARSLSQQGAETVKMKYNRIGTLFFVNYSVDNLQFLADLAKSGNEAYKDLWDTVGKTMVEELQVIVDEAKQFGECSVIYSLISDTDQGVVLISVTEGEIVYDCVNGAGTVFSLEG